MFRLRLFAPSLYSLTLSSCGIHRRLSTLRLSIPFEELEGKILWLLMADSSRFLTSKDKSDLILLRNRQKIRDLFYGRVVDNFERPASSHGASGGTSFIVETSGFSTLNVKIAK